MIDRRVRIVALCVLGLFAGACVDKNTHNYPQSSKDSFMKSCTSSSGGQEAACSCMFEKVQAKYTYGEVEQLEKDIQANKPSPEFTKFMTEARDQCVAGGAASSNSGQR